MRKFWIINVFILVSLVIVPMLVMATLPTTTSFDRQNVYPLDGFRPGGYYVVRHNAGINGFMNMSHTGGTQDFEIDAYNIKNLTLDLDEMYIQRRFLYSYDNFSYNDIIALLDGRIIINVTTVHDIEQFRFIDHPEVNVRVWLDGVVIRVYEQLEDIEITEGLTAGNHEVILEFDLYGDVYDGIILIGNLIVVIGVVWFVIRLVRDLFGGSGDYYRRFWSDRRTK